MAAPLQTEISKKAITKVAFTALTATSIEWYDFFVYGTAAALVFPSVFFAADLPPLVAQLYSFGTFAVGFLARPIGGAIFGHFGDNVGRKKALVTALMMMGCATVAIGLLPSYSTAGYLAPLMLVSLRLTQGLALGGQWAGGVLLVTESAPSHSRGYYGAFAQVGVPIGLILANFAFLAVNATVSAEAFTAWGWRLPFLASVVLIAVALYIQLKLEETPEFHQLKEASALQHQDRVRRLVAERGVPATQIEEELAAERRPSPVLEAIRNYPREIILAAGALLAVMVSFYLFTTFMIAYGTNPAGLNLPRQTMLAAVLVSQLAAIPMLLGFAAYSDRHGRYGVFMAGAALQGVWGFVMFPLIDTGSFALILLALTISQIFFAMMYGPQAALFAELFSARVRYSGASLGYQLGAILGGALAPIIATALVARYKSAFAVSIYIAIACVITILSVWRLRERQQRRAATAGLAESVGTSSSRRAF